MKRLTIILCALLCMASRHPDRMVRGDLVLNASFNRGDASDRSMYSHAPTLVGNAVITAGQRYLTLDGTGDYLTYPDSNAFSFTSGGQDQPFTVMAWIWMDNSLTSRRVICFKGAEYALELYPSTDIYKGASLTCWNSSYSAGIIAHMNSTTGITSGAWMHLAAVSSGNELPSGFSLFLNGVLQSKTEVSFGSYTGTSNTANAFQVCGAGSSYQWAGRVDDMRIYNRALTANEVAAIYSEGHP